MTQHRSHASTAARAATLAPRSYAASSILYTILGLAFYAAVDQLLPML